VATTTNDDHRDAPVRSFHTTFAWLTALILRYNRGVIFRVTRSVTILLRFTATQLRAVTWAAEIQWTTGDDAPWEPTMGRRFASI
jgi:hypothetical protein